AEVASEASSDTGNVAHRIGDVVVLFRFLQRLQAVSRDDVANFMAQHRAEFIVIRESKQRRRHIDMSAGKREAINLAALDHVKFVDETRPQTGLRATLAQAIGSR